MQPSVTDIFSDHLLRSRHDAPLPAPAEAPAWIAAYLLVCLGLLVLVKSRAYVHMQKVVQSTFSNQILQQLEREEINLFRFHALALNLLFGLNLAFLLFKLNQLGGYVLSGWPSFRQYAFFLLLVTVLFCFKLVVNRVLAYCTGDKKVIREYLTSSALVNQSFGLVLFPCLVVLQFGSVMQGFFLYAALVILGFAVILKWYRGVLMGLGAAGLGFLQILSYFCALEILPVLVLAKFVLETY